MKKPYVVFAFTFILLFQAKAQINITRSDFGVIGDILFYANDSTLNGFSIGAAGENKTWNYSTAVSANFYDSSIFKDPSILIGAPFQANLAIDQGEEIGVTYFNIDSTRVKTIIPLDDFGMDNQEITITAFPFTYLSTVKDSASTKTQGIPEDFGLSGLPYDSIRISVKITTQSTADAWGILITPKDTTNTIRVKNVTNVDVTILGKLPFIGWTTVPVNPDQRQEVYAWYGNNRKYALAEATLDSIGNVVSFKYQVDSIPQMITTGIVEQMQKSTIKMYPNPANETLIISTPNKNNVKIAILDITGKIVSEYTSKENTFSIETRDLREGMYIVQFTDEGNTTTTKFIVQH